MSVVIRCSSPNLVAAGSSAASFEEKVYFQGTNGRAVLLVHGLTGSPYEMKYLAHFFMNAAIQCRVPGWQIMDSR